MRKSQRHHKNPIHVDAPPPSESSFALSLTRQAVAQICQTLGFNGARNPAHEILTDIAIRYLKSIAKLAAASSNRHGRTESNLPDVIFALEDLSSVQGFSGASSLRSRSLYCSGVIKDLMRFVKYADEIPFAQPLPQGKVFSRGARWNILKCRGGGENKSNLSHVPRWLPPLPVVEGGGEEGEGSERERRWGCLDKRVKMEEEGDKCGVEIEIEGNYGVEIELLEKRDRVRFKIGVGLGNGGNMKGGGVCRGGGIGKRVLCSRWGGGGEENESKRIELAAKIESPRISAG